jgi:hypothetical protein
MEQPWELAWPTIIGQKEQQPLGYYAEVVWRALDDLYISKFLTKPVCQSYKLGVKKISDFIRVTCS